MASNSDTVSSPIIINNSTTFDFDLDTSSTSNTERCSTYEESVEAATSASSSELTSALGNILPPKRMKNDQVKFQNEILSEIRKSNKILEEELSQHKKALKIEENFNKETLLFQKEFLNILKNK